MITIPPQLQTNEFRFCRIAGRDKLPIDKAWNKHAHKWNSRTIIEHINLGGNYGVVCGYGNLVVVDFDNQKIQDELITKLPETLTIKSGSGCLHKYYTSDGNKSFKVFDIDNAVLVDVQSSGRQVVGPNCIHPNGNIYEIIDNRDIAFISYPALKEVFKGYRLSKRKVPESNNLKSRSAVCDYILTSIKVTDVLKYYGVDISINPTKCPMHSSKRGRCLSFNTTLYKCHHCDSGGNVINLVEDIEKCTRKEAFDKLLKWCEEGIPKNDNKKP